MIHGMDYLTTFSHSSLCTTLCLQWESSAIAIAFLYLAFRLSRYDLQAQAPCKTKSWWRQFLDTVYVHDLEFTYVLLLILFFIYTFNFTFSSHVLDLYEDKETFQVNLHVLSLSITNLIFIGILIIKSIKLPR